VMAQVQPQQVGFVLGDEQIDDHEGQAGGE
jgi:hypothetical protein